MERMATSACPPRPGLQIAMLYLEDEDAVSAETYIKKASSLLSSVKVRRCACL